MKLVTMPISHYCDKARWALDRAGLDYDEARHLQLFHYPFAWMAGGGRTVPVLDVDGAVYADSHEILRFAEAFVPEDARLYPDAQRYEVMGLERQLDTVFGVETRKLFYDHTADSAVSFFMRYNNPGAPLLERAVFPVVFPLGKLYGFRRMRINPESLGRARATVFTILDEMAERLSDGRPYLCGDRFTAADLTFAALSAPVSLPREYGVPLPTLEECPEAYQQLLGSLDDHPAITHARNMYREERRRLVASPA